MSTMTPIRSAASRRLIGPAVMSGRIAASTPSGDRRRSTPARPAAASGNRSTAGWSSPVSTSRRSRSAPWASIARTRRPSGSGPAKTWLRNSISIGDGVYRPDGGENWERMGLEGTERIAAVAIDPKNSSTVFVCAAGHAFDANPDRGVTGPVRRQDLRRCRWSTTTPRGDPAIDPQDGNILYAGMWQYRRPP
jgi:hypothetical protein